MFDIAKYHTKSAIIIHQTLTGDYRNLKNALVLNTKGMSDAQFQQLSNAINNSGYEITANENREDIILTKKKK